MFKEKIISSIFCIGLLGCNFVGATNTIGLDIFQSYFSLKQKYGKEIYEKHLRGFNIFGQHYFNEDMVFEYGYEYMKSEEENVLNGNDHIPGAQKPLGFWNKYNTQIRHKSPYISLGYSKDFGNKFTISYLGGISIVNVTGFHEWIDSEVGPVNATATALSRRHFDKNQISLLLKLAINREFNDFCGMRFISTWKKLDHFKIKSADQKSEIRLKNFLSVGLGIYYKL